MARRLATYLGSVLIVQVLTWAQAEGARPIQNATGDLSVELLREHEHGGHRLYRKQCISRKVLDRSSQLVCAYLKYKESGKGIDFIDAIPANPAALSALWHIDDRLSRGMGPEYSGPRSLHDGSFGFSFVDAVVEQVHRQNPKALQRLLLLNSTADGAAAEYIADLMVDVFDNEATFVLTNWSIVRPFDNTIGFESTDLSSRRPALKRKYRRLCTRSGTSQEACAGVKKLLGIESISQNEGEDVESNPGVLKGIACILRGYWPDEEKKTFIDDTVWFRSMKGKIPGTSGQEYSGIRNIVVYSKDMRRGILFFVDGGKEEVLVLSNSYDLDRTTDGWQASEGNGGMGTYRAIGEFADALEKTPLLRARSDLAPRNVKCRWTP